MSSVFDILYNHPLILACTTTFMVITLVKKYYIFNFIFINKGLDFYISKSENEVLQINLDISHVETVPYKSSLQKRYLFNFLPDDSNRNPRQYLFHA